MWRLSLNRSLKCSLISYDLVLLMAAVRHGSSAWASSLSCLVLLCDLRLSWCGLSRGRCGEHFIRAHILLLLFFLFNVSGSCSAQLGWHLAFILGFNLHQVMMVRVWLDSIQVLVSNHHTCCTDSTSNARAYACLATLSRTHLLDLLPVLEMVHEVLVMRLLGNNCLLVEEAFRKRVVLPLNAFCLLLPHHQVETGWGERA